MSQNASGQLLGYAMQFPRALCHLLKAGPGCTVCIEVHGDVATLLPTGEIIAEEDKSSINSNPVTDKSVNLWKTLSNWVDSVRAGEFDVKLTTFVLYRNKSGQLGLAEVFDACATRDQANQALLDADPEFANLDESHAIWPYYKNVVLDYPDILLDVIVKFQLETGDLAGYADVEQGLRTKLVALNQLDAVVHHLNGWLVKLVMTRISQNQAAIITFDEFAHECAVLFSRARCFDLLDFTTYSPLSSDEIDKHIKSRPTYLRQIEFLKADNDDLIEAVTDFLKAKTNRDKWIEDELIDEELASQFEENLRRFWKNKQKEVKLVNGTLDKEARGMVLFVQCQSHQETIRNVKPPPSTIAGTYHALADKPNLGWHEDWEAEFKR
ncbi:ABC-three component system protein [Janthinobacterium sp.]|uniref:ABC-three component system protein n=1 Tax=Janthinobacterium sp. TaxID=1871054 RepID=UPI0025BC1F5E|nr:ABC-three component system protein [Janthinobacterium sp.]